MDYGKVLSRSWEIVWQNKWMWVLGFLAALGSSGGGGSNFNFRNSSSGGGDIPDFNNIPGFENIEALIPLFIAGMCIIFMLMIVFALLRLVGEGGLIASAYGIETGEKMSLSDGFGAGTHYLPKMIGLFLALRGIFILFGFIGGIGGAIYAFNTVSSGGSEEEIFAALGPLFLCFGCAACIIGLLSLVVSFIYPFAQRGIIIDNKGVMESIGHAWQVLTDNIAEIILLAVIFGAIGIGIGIITAVVALPVGLIFFLPTILNMAGGGSLGIGGVLFMVVGVVIMIIIAAGIQSILRAMQSTAFTLGYMEWTGKTKTLDSELAPNMFN